MGRVALWFLFNGAFIHITMDGLTGGYHMLDLLNRHYVLLDRRFLTDEITSWMITQLELFIMAPLSLLAYVTVVKKSSFRYPVTILLSTMQLLGAIFFFGTQFFNDF